MLDTRGKFAGIRNLKSRMKMPHHTRVRISISKWVVCPLPDRTKHRNPMKIYMRYHYEIFRGYQYMLMFANVHFLSLDLKVGRRQRKEKNKEARLPDYSRDCIFQSPIGKGSSTLTPFQCTLVLQVILIRHLLSLTFSFSIRTGENKIGF